MALYPVALGGWSVPVRISEPGPGYYPKITASGDTVHVIYQSPRQYTKICYLRSTNSGNTWSQPLDLLDRVNTSSPWYPQIIEFGNRLMALWEVYLTQQISHYNITYRISNDNGLTWNPPGYLLTENRPWGFPFVASGAGILTNIMAPCTLIDSTVYYSNIRTTNFGQDWLEAMQIFGLVESGIPDQASLDSHVFLLWSGRFDRSRNFEVYYTHSDNGGLNWSENFAISDTDQFHSQFPSISVNNLGFIGVSWMDFKYSPYLTTGDIFFRQSLDSGMTWLPERQLTVNHLALRSDIVSVGDTIIIAWEDQRPENGQGSIYILRSYDNGQSWGEPEWVDMDFNSSRNPAIAASNSKIYLIWEESGIAGDSSGLYFSRFDSEPDAIGNSVNENLPEKIELSAYPNPFNSATTITLSGVEQAEIGIYDITGCLITSLHTIGGQALWDARAYSSGLYFARLAGEKTSAIKLVLIK
jgi:hypothetical protein